MIFFKLNELLMIVLFPHKMIFNQNFAKLIDGRSYRFTFRDGNVQTTEYDCEFFENFLKPFLFIHFVKLSINNL